MEKQVKEQKKGMRKSALTVYIFFVMAIFLIPFVSMGVAPVDEDAQNQSLAEWPDYIVDGHFNGDILLQMGDYFEDHFGFRQQLITVNSALDAKLFAVSPTDQVVVGSDGWLYYGGTMDDYQRKVLMSNHAAENAAYNISLMQEYVQRRGARFLFTIAPNKNSLYPDNMPFYEREGSGAKSINALEKQLDAYGVNYVDLFDTFESDPRVLYMKTDTHWNNDGALLAFNTLMNQADIPHDDYSSFKASTQTDFVGDIQTMLYPLSKTAEFQPLYEESLQFTYTNASSNVSDPDITTASTKTDASGNLMMYRDSFANALLPYFATQYASAQFSKLVPYDLTQIIDSKSDTVIVERAERHIDFFATDAPIMAAPVAKIDNPSTVKLGAARIEASQDGSYYVFSGDIDPAAVSDGYSVYIGIVKEGESVDYLQAFRITRLEEGEDVSCGNDFGYTARIPKSALTHAKQRVIVAIVDASGTSVVADETIDLSQA